jgi:hypothetical protein
MASKDILLDNAYLMPQFLYIMTMWLTILKFKVKKWLVMNRIIKNSLYLLI